MTAYRADFQLLGLRKYTLKSLTILSCSCKLSQGLVSVYKLISYRYLYHCLLTMGSVRSIYGLCIVIVALYGTTTATSSTGFWNVSLGLTEVPFDIIQDWVLGIWLNDNNIRRIDSFRPFPSLLAIFLDDNQLIEFPELCNVSATLLHINLERNQIAYIRPARLDCLTTLVQLILNVNYLKEIPDVAGPSNTLIKLEVILNRFEEVPDIRVLGRSLVIYHFSTFSMQMSDIPSMPWLSETVKVLGVGGLGIKQVSPERLYPLIHLRELFLYYNKLPDIPDLWPLAESLEKIELGHNPLQQVSISRLNSLPKLTQVVLNGCNLTRAPNLCKLSLSNVTVILTKNLLVCDCHMRWLKMAEMSGMDVRLARKPCTAPPHLVNKHWDNITVDELLCNGKHQPIIWAFFKVCY